MFKLTCFECRNITTNILFKTLRSYDSANSRIITHELKGFKLGRNSVGAQNLESLNKLFF